VRAQSGQYGPAHIEVGAQATGVVTLETPAIHGRDLTEGYLTQPLVMAMASFWSDALQLKGIVDFEGVTMKRGELNAGAHGEGYIDRRHPHTYLHELLLTSERRFGDNGASLTSRSITISRRFWNAPSRSARSGRDALLSKLACSTEMSRKVRAMFPTASATGIRGRDD